MPNELKFNMKYRVPASLMYDTLTNETEIKKFTQSATQFVNSAGGEFSFYDGFISGTNELLEPGRKIVQSWKFNNWKDYGELTLTFKEKPGNECMIVVHMKNIPERDNYNQTVDLPNLEAGFKSQIFDKISTFLGYPQNNDQDSDSDDE